MNANRNPIQIAAFIRVYSCPFAVEICSYRPLPPHHTLFRPEDWKTTNGREGDRIQIAAFIRVIRVHSRLKFAPIDLSPTTLCFALKIGKATNGRA